MLPRIPAPCWTWQRNREQEPIAGRPTGGVAGNEGGNLAPDRESLRLNLILVETPVQKVHRRVRDGTAVIRQRKDSGVLRLDEFNPLPSP